MSEAGKERPTFLAVSAECLGRAINCSIWNSWLARLL